MSKTLLLVDDHPIFRRGIRELIINHCKDYERVLEADTGEEALKQLENHPADCVMLDIAMPGLDGLKTLELIKQRSPTTQCIMISMHDNPNYVVQSRIKGAVGYLLKSDPDRFVIECLHSVRYGVHYVSPTLRDKSDYEPMDDSIESTDLDRLSKREKQILALIAQNKTSKEIAVQLEVSLRTVQNHRVNICRKLRIDGPNALLKVAIENQQWL